MTIQLFHSLLTLTTILRLSTDINSFVPKSTFFSNKYIVKHHKFNTIFRNSIEYHNVKCWKSYCIYNNYINNLNEDNMIFLLDFNINKEDINNPFIKVDYLIVKNDENKLILKSVINYIENWAIKEKIYKIIVNFNLSRYYYEFKELGFIHTI
jgi:hypothetical protein